MSILIFGKNGQVARCLRENAPDAIALGSDDCDLMMPGTARDAIRAHKPDVVINAAAYTGVDKAEDDELAATHLNANAPAEMATAASAMGARFLHISTDYVFDGTSSDNYRETSPTGPLSVYGATKLKGEDAVLAAAPDAVILRTSWVFSEYGTNFVKTMLRLGAERDELNIVADQVGGPTPAQDIARTLIVIAGKLMRGAPGSGLYHYQGAPAASWADFAKAIFEEAQLPTRVTAIPTSDYPTPAIRPLRTILDCSRIERDFGIAPPDWRIALTQIIASMQKNSLKTH